MENTHKPRSRGTHGVTRDQMMASVRARAWYTDEELLDLAVLWHSRDPRIAWQWREAWAIRCVDGKEEDVGLVQSG